MGDWAAAQGLWLRAAEYFKLLFRVDQMATPDVATLDSTRCAVALIEAGDASGYEQFRRDIVERFAATRYPVEAERTVKNSLAATGGQNGYGGLGAFGRSLHQSGAGGHAHGGAGTVAGRYRLAL